METKQKEKKGEKTMKDLKSIEEKLLEAANELEEMFNDYKNELNNINRVAKTQRRCPCCNRKLDITDTDIKYIGISEHKDTKILWFNDTCDSTLIFKADKNEKF